MKEAILLAIIIAVMLIPQGALADDGELAANDYRGGNATCLCGIEWPARIPVQYREGAGDERFVIYAFTPIPIEFPEPECTYCPVIVKYDVPPGLDVIQATRWGQALPSARAHLARLYGIDQETAQLYGAIYQ